MCDYDDNGHPPEGVVHRNQGSLWTTSRAQTARQAVELSTYPQDQLLQLQNLKSKELLASSQTLRERADHLVRGWWERQHPRPIQKFVVVRQVAERALAAGWPPDLLLEAMDNVPTISARWLEGYVNRHKKGAQPDRLAAVKRMLENE